VIKDDYLAAITSVTLIHSCWICVSLFIYDKRKKLTDPKLL